MSMNVLNPIVPCSNRRKVTPSITRQWSSKLRVGQILLARGARGHVLAAGFVVSGWLNSAHAMEGVPNLKLIELFTSLSCSSCPPAEELLVELVEEHEDLLALEFHVDYWNDIVVGKDGNFVDPFSHAKFSNRQREYNAANIKGRSGVYTPQAVVNGRVAQVGSDKSYIMKALSKPVEQMLHIVISEDPGQGMVNISVRGEEQAISELRGTDIYLVRYIDEGVTEITGGENRHRTQRLSLIHI